MEIIHILIIYTFMRENFMVSNYNQFVMETYHS